MSSYDLAEVWVKFLEKFHESTSENVYNAWIKPLIPLEITIPSTEGSQRNQAS